MPNETPLRNYQRTDPHGGIDILMSLFPDEWIAITVERKGNRVTTFMPYRQLVEIIEDMKRTIGDGS